MSRYKHAQSLRFVWDSHQKLYYIFTALYIFTFSIWSIIIWKNQAGALCISRHHTPQFFLPYFLYSSVTVLPGLMCSFKAFWTLWVIQWSVANIFPWFPVSSKVNNSYFLYFFHIQPLHTWNLLFSLMYFLNQCKHSLHCSGCIFLMQLLLMPSDLA